MNNTCAVCGGFVGDFMYAGDGARICPGNCHTPTVDSEGWDFDKKPHTLWGFVHGLPISGVQYADLCKGITALIASVRAEEFQKGFVEGQKHAFGVDKDRVRAEEHEKIKAELTRLRNVRILIPKNVGGNSKCITEGYHRCLDKLEKFIRDEAITAIKGEGK